MKKFSKYFRLVFVVLVLAAAFAIPVFAKGLYQDDPLAPVVLTALSLGTILQTIFTVALDYFPVIAKKFDSYAEAKKKLIVAAGAIIIVGGLFGLTCANVLTTNLVCSTSGGLNAVTTIIWVFIVGQGVHIGTRPTAEFKKDELDINPKLAGKS